MEISLDKPELEKFIQARIDSGEFASATEVIEAGLARLMLDPLDEELTTEDVAAILESEKQFANGEGLDWDVVSRELRAKYLKK
jgi:Arc/MetJ-type ribon-helix-helix transcriptional regulator